MNFSVKITLFLIVILFVYSCSSKVNSTLKLNAIISAKIEPIFNQPLEIANAFDLGLTVRLNKGKTKKKFTKNVNIYNKIADDDLNYYNENETEKYWKNFDINTYNCRFSNGKIYFSRKAINVPDFIAVKITSKNGNVTDSIYIKIPKITEVKIEYNTNTTLSPSFFVPFNIVAYYDNDKKIIVSDNNGFDGFSGSYNVKIQNTSVTYPYQYKIPTEMDFKTSFTVTCNHIANTSLGDSINIPLKYDGHYRFFYNSANGQNGNSGSDAYRKLRNGNGENGQKGQNGQNGGTGQKVYVILKSFLVDSTLYIKTIAYSNDVVNTCIINTKLGKISVLNIGGHGGAGGEGGGGANGEDQTAKNAAGIGGNGGEGGDGGEGGKGGSFKVYADSTASLYIDRIALINTGGNGGSGGRGGKNGLSGNEKGSSAGSYFLQTLIKIVFPGRGPIGMTGFNGENGEESVFEIISNKAIDQMEQRVRKR